MRGIEHGDRGRPRVALTFDDGPSADTGAVLDALSRHGARATFFVLGPVVAGRPEALRRMRAEGHEIAVHGYSHDRLAGRPLKTWREVTRTRALVLRAAGVRPLHFRAPHGDATRTTVAAARLARLRTVGWDVDPRDWQAPGAEVIAARVLAAVGPGSIVDLHDGRGRRQGTVDALELVLPALRERGLEPVTVATLLEAP